MKLRGIIFDLDGVLCHTDEYHYRAWSIIAKKLGVPFDENINKRLRGVSRQDSLEIILENYKGRLDLVYKATLLNEKNQYYKDMLREMTPADLDEIVLKTLVGLRTAGYKLAVGSSSKNAKLILSRLGLGEFFDAVADGEQISHSKPNPEVFLLAAKLIDLAPENCLVVEDAEAGLKAAKAGGFLSAGIGDVAKSGLADYALQELSDLLTVAAELNDNKAAV